MDKTQPGKPPVHVCECGGTAFAFYAGTGAGVVIDRKNAALLSRYDWLPSMKMRRVTRWGRWSRNKPLHRLVMNARPGECVRPRNGSLLDCRRENLEKKAYRAGYRAVGVKGKARTVKGRCGRK